MLAICEKAVECRAKGVHCDHGNFHEHGFYCCLGHCYPSNNDQTHFQKYIPVSLSFLQVHRCLTEDDLGFYAIAGKMGVELPAPPHL